MADRGDGGDAVRERLLQRAGDYLVQHGAGELSLRGLAAEIGTSHRMLIYHFGSKEQLLVELVRGVERRTRALLDELGRDPGGTWTEISERFWRIVSDPGLWPNERLFFELYAMALQGRPHTAGFLQEVVDAWLVPLTEGAVRLGVPEATARAEARLGIAVLRGLMLDLLATGDRAGVDAAFARYQAWSPAVDPPGRSAPRRRQ